MKIIYTPKKSEKIVETIMMGESFFLDLFSDFIIAGENSYNWRILVVV